MKNVTSCDIGVFEREDFSLCFGRITEPDNTVKELHLYRVQFPPCFVLASSPEGAISQADCIIVENKGSGLSKDTTAERVSFGLRGWSGNQF